MKLKRIEIRTPEEYNVNCRRVQFYIHAPYKTLLTLEQTDNERDEVILVGEEILAANGMQVNDTLNAYILGITEDDDTFIFEPYQELLAINEISVFKFKNVIRTEEKEECKLN